MIGTQRWTDSSKVTVKVQISSNYIEWGISVEKCPVQDKSQMSVKLEFEEVRNVRQTAIARRSKCAN